MTIEPKTHDYTKPGWGKSYTVKPIGDGTRCKMSGFGRGIREGDYLLMKNGDGLTRYQVESISYYQDPPDMWNATTVFAPDEEAQETDNAATIAGL